MFRRSLIALYVAAAPAAGLAAKDTVRIHSYEACGKLSFDAKTQKLLFANYRFPGGSRFAFPVTLFYDSVDYKQQAFQKLQEIFYLPQEPGKPVKVDPKLARDGVIVRVEMADGPRTPKIETNRARPGYSYLTLDKEFYVQLLDVEKIAPEQCVPVAEGR